MDQRSARRASTGIGVISLAIGAGLAARPDTGATFGLDRAATLGVAALDAVVGAGLLAGARRPRWMVARAAANGLIAAPLLRGGAPAGRATAAALAGLTCGDLAIARTLARGPA